MMTITNSSQPIPEVADASEAETADQLIARDPLQPLRDIAAANSADPLFANFEAGVRTGLAKRQENCGERELLRNAGFDYDPSKDAGVGAPPDAKLSSPQVNDAGETESAVALIARLDAECNAIEQAARARITAGIAELARQLDMLRALLAVPRAVIRQDTRNEFIVAWLICRQIAVGQLTDFGAFRPDAQMDDYWSEHVLATALTLKRTGQGGDWQDPDGYELMTHEVTVGVDDDDMFDLPAMFTAELAVGIEGNPDRTVDVEITGRLSEALRVDGKLVAIYEIEKV